MNYADYECINFERTENVLRVELNRPEVLNAVNETLHHELARVFHDVALDDEVGVVVLTGAGEAFCAGGDVSMMERITQSESLYSSLNVQGKRIVYSLLELEKPIICRLNGDAIGLGASIALLCDLIVATEGARIGDPHIRFGLVPGDGGCLILPSLIGHARAKELLFFGDLLTASEAKELGLINRVCAPDQLDHVVNEFVTKLSNGPLRAISYTKTVVNSTLKREMHAIMDSGIAHEVLSQYEPFHKEKVNRFLQRSYRNDP
tara:strand:- start:2604 stop:3392 length:789 start_codon:yes stop_codon:yes gene_type:complete